MDSLDMHAWLVLNASGLSIDRQMCLLDAFGSPAAALAADDRALAALQGFTVLHVQKLRNAQAGGIDVAALERKLGDLGATILPITAPAYPQALHEIPSPPPLLIVRGDLPGGDCPYVAIVGTRKCTPYGRQVAHKLAGDLAARGVVVTSGMALGIDGEAHQGALDAGGRTVAVLGCGIDITYPPQHKDLADSIAAKGAIITEFPLGTGPGKYTFPQRNRIISGLSLGVVVIDAPPKSGALITAGLAGDQGRTVFAVPGDITRPESRGGNLLIRDGAVLVQSAEDILDELNLSPAAMVGRPALGGGPSLPPEEAAAFEALAGGVRTVDDLVAATSLDAHKVMAALMLLEMKGLVRRFGGGTYGRADA